MAPYFYDQNLEDENEGQNGSVQISGASPTTDSEGGDGAGGEKKGLDTGSGFQNLDSYLSTNQSKDFGKQVLGKVGGEIEGARENQQQASEQFKNQVSGSNRLADMNDVNAGIANPTSADKDQFKEWRTQTYQGPQSLAESPDAWNQYWSGTNKANTQAKLLGNEAGRFSLLDSYFGKPSYNFGEKSLDNLLVQQSGLGKETRDLQNQAALLKSQGDTQSKDLQSVASQRKGEVDANRQGVQSALGIDAQGNVLTGDKAGALGKQYQTVDDQLAAQNLDRKAQQDAIASHIASNQFTSDDLNSLGLLGGENIYDLNLENYLTQGGELNKNQTISPEQRAYIQALSELSGVTDTFASGEAQEKTNPYSYDSSRLKNDAAAKQAEYTRMQSEAPVKVGSNSGKVLDFTMGDLEKQIAAAKHDIEIGGTPNASRAFLKYAEPALAEAKSKLAAQYQVDRKIQGSNAGSIARPSAGVR